MQIDPSLVKVTKVIGHGTFLNVTGLEQSLVYQRFSKKAAVVPSTGYPLLLGSHHVSPTTVTLLGQSHSRNQMDAAS